MSKQTQTVKNPPEKLQPGDRVRHRGDGRTGTIVAEAEPSSAVHEERVYPTGTLITDEDLVSDQLISKICAAEIALEIKAGTIQKDLCALFRMPRDIDESKRYAERLLFNTLEAIAGKEKKEVTAAHPVVKNINNHVRQAFKKLAAGDDVPPGIPKLADGTGSAWCLRKPKGAETFSVEIVKPRERAAQNQDNNKADQPVSAHEMQAARARKVGELLAEMARSVSATNDPETRTMLRTTASNGLAAYRDLFNALRDGREYKVTDTDAPVGATAKPE